MKSEIHPWENTDISFKDDIEYFINYKNSLCQYIISNTCYKGDYYKKQGHVKLTALKLTSLLEEIQKIKVHILMLKLRDKYPGIEEIFPSNKSF